MMARHHGMVGRRRYGGMGMFALPYFVIFELFGPVIEVVGTIAFIAAVSLGIISVGLALALFTVAVLFGLLISFSVLLMEERAFRRYPGWRCLRRLIFSAVIENFGYRQLNAVIRVRAWWTVFRAGGWGEMEAGFEQPEVSQAEVSPSAP
jgi:hypothetical protein